MAVVKFKNLCKKCEESNLELSFIELKDELATVSPVKAINKSQLILDQDAKTFFHSSKECIIKNFCINPSILKEPIYNIQILKDLYAFLNQDSPNEDLMAQCIFLVHNSKLDCSKTFMVDVLENFASIKISHRVEVSSCLFDELEIFFIKIKKNSSIQNTISQVIDEIVISDRKFKFEDLTLKFIDSDFNRLCAFAGINTIYVNTKLYLEILSSKKFNKFTFDQKLSVIKLDFLAVIIHETGHIALRFKLNDMNKSSPVLTQKQDENEEETNQKVLKDVNECGLECEKKFFKYIINWPDSLYSFKLNLDYCNEILKSVGDGKSIQFDVSKTEFEIYDEDQFCQMACYFRPPNKLMYH